MCDVCGAISLESATTCRNVANHPPPPPTIKDIAKIINEKKRLEFERKQDEFRKEHIASKARGSAYGPVESTLIGEPYPAKPRLRERIVGGARAIPGTVGGALGKVAGAVVKDAAVGGLAAEAGLSTAAWFGRKLSQNVKAKTLESIGLVILAAFLVYFGFIFAAMGALFFMFYLYLPTETDILADARARTFGLTREVRALKGSYMEKIDELGAQIADVDEDLTNARTLNDSRLMFELTAKRRDLIKSLTQIQKEVAKSTELDEESKKEIKQRADLIEFGSKGGSS